MSKNSTRSAAAAAAPVAEPTPAEEPVVVAEPTPVAEPAPVADAAAEEPAAAEPTPAAEPSTDFARGGSLTKPLADAHLELAAAQDEVRRATTRRDNHLQRPAGVHPHTLRWLAIAQKRLANAEARVAELTAAAAAPAAEEATAAAAE